MCAVLLPKANRKETFSLYFYLRRFSLLSVNSLSCYTCTSEDSLKDCNSKLKKKGCPSGTPNCVTGTLTCSAGEVTKTVFYKKCGTKGKDCDPASYPSCPSSQTGWSYSSVNQCCTGDNCNAAHKNGSGSLGPKIRINGALTGMSIFLAFWGFSFL